MNDAPPPNGLAAEGLVVALDQLGVPAFVSDANGRPVYANAIGTEMFDRDPAGMTQNLTDRITRFAPDVREIRAPGLPPHWLVVLSPGSPGTKTPDERVAAAARIWNLTARQIEVLRLVVTGDANKSIAARLSCAEATIEAHITALLRKSRVENRAQLVARFWTL